MKYKTSKLQKLEKSRTNSIITKNLNNCFICGRPKDDIHEIFGGANRQRSMIYGLYIPLCRWCHSRIHNNSDLMDMLHRKAQLEFEKNHTRDEFIQIIGKNYLM